MAKQVYGKDTRMAMAPIKKKKRAYYALVVILVFVVGSGLFGWSKYGKIKRQMAFDDAVAKMEVGTRMDDFQSLNEAELAIREEAKRDNPRPEAIAYDVILRSWIWFTYTGEEVLMSDCRKYISFLKDPFVDDTGHEYESPHKDHPMTAVAEAAYKAVYDDPEGAIAFLGSMDPSLLSPGEKEFWIGVAHWSAGEWVPAEAEMRRAVAAADTPRHHFGLARVLDLGGKADAARTEYKAVLATNPNHHGAEAYELILDLPEDPAKRLEAIDGFFTKYQGQVEARIASNLTIEMANALWQTGETDKAFSAISQARIADPGFKPLREWAPPKPPQPAEGEEEGADKAS